MNHRALIALLGLLSIGLALRGAFGGDAFVAGAVTTIAASILLFTAWPILRILVQAFENGDGAFEPGLVVERLAAAKIWSLRCLSGGGTCRGIRWWDTGTGREVRRLDQRLAHRRQLVTPGMTSGPRRYHPPRPCHRACTEGRERRVGC